jgi:uncharacterized protein YcfL
MKPIRPATITILIFLGLALAACAQTPTTDTPQTRETLLVDPEVQFSMEVTEVLEKQLPQADGSSLLQIQFAVKATSKAPMAWKVTWFDAEGRTVKGVSESYRNVSVLPGQTRYFSATAPHSDVVAYQLHLREPG